MVVRCIFVGVRRRGRLLIDTLTTDRRFEAVALVDESVATCRQAIASNGWMDLPCYDNLVAAMSAVPAHAVVLMDDCAGRAQAVRAALKMGLHVFVANPLATTLAEARELVRCADDHNVGIVVDPEYRYGVTERTLAAWRREGRHGALRRAHLSLSTGQESVTMWEGSAAHLSALLPIVGWGVDRVTDTQSEEGLLRATFMLREGRACTYETGPAVDGVELRLDFERASVRAVGPQANDKALELALEAEDFQSVGIADTDDPDPAERFPKESFYKLVTQGGRVADDGLEHLQTLAVVDAMQRAVTSGQSESINP